MCAAPVPAEPPAAGFTCLPSGPCCSPRGRAVRHFVRLRLHRGVIKRARRRFESFAALAKADAAPGKREADGTVSRRSWAGRTGQADIVPGQGLGQLGAEFSPAHPRGSLALIGSTPISGGGADIDARLSPDGKTLSVDGSGGHILSVFAVNGGTLTELPSSPTPLPAGGAPAGIVNI